MKKSSVFILLSIFLVFLFARPSISEETKDRSEILNQCVAYMSQLQSFIEFYFMETGVYPRSLKELDRIFNEEASSEKIIFPKDPGTGKDFIYETGSDCLSYRLACPDPSVYGLKKLQLTQLNWGWMKVISEEKRRKAYAFFCKYNIDMISKAVKKYLEEVKKLPQNLKALSPKYLKKVTACPVTGHDYIYLIKGDIYTVACPDPKEHGCGVFEINSKDGLVIKPIEQKNNSEKNGPETEQKNIGPFKKPK